MIPCRRPTRPSRVLATAAVLSVATLAPSLSAAQASEVTHPAVVSANPVDWTPNLVAVSGQPKPVALSVAEAGDRMVVGGRFSAVEDGTRHNPVSRSNVVAFSATASTAVALLLLALVRVAG